MIDQPVLANKISMQSRIPAQPQQNQELIQKVQKGMKRMSNGYRVRLFFDRFIQHQQNTVLALMATVIISVIYYQLDYYAQYSYTVNVLLYANIGATVFTLILMFLRHQAFNEWKKSQLLENQVKGLLSLIINSCLILIQPYPFLNDITFISNNHVTQYSAQFKLNYFLVIFAMLRFLLIVPLFFLKSKFMTPRSIRICKMYGCQPTFLYVIKCMFKQVPIKVVVSWFIFSIALFSFIFRVAQRGIVQPGKAYVFNHWTNTLWVTLITMTTVGYGDMAPGTDLGRMLGLLCVIWGGFLVSVMVVVLTNTFNLDQSQKRTLVILKRLEVKQEIKKVAGQYLKVSLTRLWRNYKNLKKNPKIGKKSKFYDEDDQQIQTGPLILSENLNQRKLKMQFHHLRRLSKMNLMDIDLKEDMTRHFERIDSHLQSLKKNADSLIDYINEEYFAKGPTTQEAVLEQFGVKQK